MFPWFSTDVMREWAIPIKRGKGIYVYDYDGKEYIDLTSQSMSNNLGYGIPKQI